MIRIMKLNRTRKAQTVLHIEITPRHTSVAPKSETLASSEVELAARLDSVLALVWGKKKEKKKERHK